MFTKKPTGSGEGFIEGTDGSRYRISVRAGFDFKLTDNLFGRISGVYKHQDGYVNQYDFGCLYPAGGSATFTANDGTTKQTNPAGGIPAVKSAGSCLVDKLGEIGYQAIRGALRYNPSNAIDINVTGEYIHDKHSAAGEVLAATNLIDNPNTNIGTNPPQYAGGFPGVPYDNRFICGKFCNFSSYSSPAINYIGLLTPGGLAGPGQPLQATQNSNESVYNAYNLAANAHFALNDMFSIDNILAYQHWNTQFGVDDDLSPIPLSGGFNSLKHWNWSEELRLNAKLASNVNAVIGGYYFKQETDYFSYQDLRYINAAPGLGLFPLQFIQPDRTPAQAKAAFADINWEVVPGLTFDGGIRYTDEAKQYHYFRYNPDGVTINPYVEPVGAVAGAGAPGALTGLVARYHGSRWDYRAALNYRFSPEVMIYVSTATGFKGGGTNPRPFYASQAIAFSPEVLTNYEVGLKTDLFDRRLRFDIDGFYAKLKNAQVGVSVCPVADPLQQTPCAATINGGNAREWGIEAEFTARPVDGFSIDGSASYLNFKYTSLVAGTTVALGDPLAGSPKWKWTLGAQYEADLGSFGSLTPRVDASYQAKTYTGFKYNNVPQYIGSYALVNARLTWQNTDKDLSVSLEGTNLTNKYYYVTLFDLRAAGAGLDKAQPGRPREWAVTVKKTFGGSSALPPPPPPAPVAPAMQTCPDGSQVLATQACAVPPPPAPQPVPPPPAAAPVGERG
jgi:iron complex outermembrane receptor protein